MVKSNSNRSVYTPYGSTRASSDDRIAIPTSAATATGTAKKQYKGVRMRRWGSWVSEIRAPNNKTRIWLGSYSLPEAAARAYDAALLCLKGSSASLNFPDSTLPFFLPTTSLMSPKSIQRVAASAAANVFTAAPSPPPVTPIVSSPSSRTTGDSTTASMEDELVSDNYNHFDFGAFQSPKCMDDDQLLNQYWATLAPMQECDDYEGDLSLWSFC